MDKCVKCLDGAINEGRTFGLDDIPDAVVTIPFLQVFTLAAGGQVLGPVAIRVCLECRRKELKPGRIQAVQGVLLDGKQRGQG